MYYLNLESIINSCCFFCRFSCLTEQWTVFLICGCICEISSSYDDRHINTHVHIHTGCRRTNHQGIPAPADVAMATLSRLGQESPFLHSLSWMENIWTASCRQSTRSFCKAFWERRRDHSSTYWNKPHRVKRCKCFTFDTAKSEVKAVWETTITTFIYHTTYCNIMKNYI